MKRHPALIPLSHDHQHALAAALRLRRAGEGGAGDEVLAAVRSFNRFARREMLPHFEDEEQALVPLLAAGDAGTFASMIVRLVRDHAAIRAEHLWLERAVAGDADGQLLAAAAVRVAGMVHDHVRWEERQLFEAAQAELADDALAGLGLPSRDGSGEVPEALRLLALRDPQRVDGIALGAMHATPIDLAPGELRPAWSAGIEIVLVVMRGDLEVSVDDSVVQLIAPAATIVAAGVERALRAGTRGALVLSVHGPRPSLAPT